MQDSQTSRHYSKLIRQNLLMGPRIQKLIKQNMWLQWEQILIFF